MEQCYYCGQRAHPLPRYTNQGRLRYVCHFRCEGDETNWRIVETDCRKKAEADGFVFRPDLTPKR